MTAARCLNAVSGMVDIRDVVGTETHMIHPHQVSHVIDMVGKYVSSHAIRVGHVNKCAVIRATLELINFHSPPNRLTGRRIYQQFSTANYQYAIHNH